MLIGKYQLVIEDSQPKVNRRKRRRPKQPPKPTRPITRLIQQNNKQVLMDAGDYESDGSLTESEGERGKKFAKGGEVNDNHDKDDTVQCGEINAAQVGGND